MTLFFGILDTLLSTIMLFDTLGLVYQFRKNNTCEEKEYIRVCLSWILFLTINNFFSCEKRGFFGSMIRLTIFLAKLFVVLPILGGTLRFHKYFIVDKNAEKWCQFLKSKICKNCKDNSATSNISGGESSNVGETISG